LFSEICFYSMNGAAGSAHLFDEHFSDEHKKFFFQVFQARRGK